MATKDNRKLGGESRRQPRFPLKEEVHYQVGDARHAGELENISKTGLCIRSEGPLPPHGRLKLEITLPRFTLAGPSSAESHTHTIIATFNGRVIWTRSNMAGVRFVDNPAESLQALEQFIRRYFLIAGADDLRSFVDSLFQSRDEDRPDVVDLSAPIHEETAEIPTERPVYALRRRSDTDDDR
jgi:hypothetical protein